jgi:hypothetical protein
MKKEIEFLKEGRRKKIKRGKKGDNEFCIVGKENNNHEGCHRTLQKEFHQFKLQLEFNVMGRFCMQLKIK